VALAPGVRALTGGVFICPGFGQHPQRTLDSWELIVVERGRLGLAVGDRRHDIGTGSWVLMPSGVPHAGTAAYPRDLRFLWMHFQLQGRPSLNSLEVPGSGTLTDPVSILTSMRRLIGHFGAIGFDQRVADCLVALILSELAVPSKVLAAGDDLAHRALRLIRVRFREPLVPLDVARSLRVSLDHLARRFRIAHGCRISEAINRERLHEASRLLLLGGGISLTEVALAAGFADVQWFRRLFVRQHGISPRTWRRLHARIHTNTG
jgi:AraC-like DNA-binding protein